MSEPKLIITPKTKVGELRMADVVLRMAGNQDCLFMSEIVTNQLQIRISCIACKYANAISY